MTKVREGVRRGEKDQSGRRGVRRGEMAKVGKRS